MLSSYQSRTGYNKLSQLLKVQQHTCLSQWIFVIVLAKSGLWRRRPFSGRRRMLLKWTVLRGPEIHQPPWGSDLPNSTIYLLWNLANAQTDTLTPTYRQWEQKEK